jgi:plastocyanin
VRRALTSVALFVCLTTLASCSDDSPKTRPTQPPKDLRGMAAVEVEANENLFTPERIIIDAGTKVTWNNTDTIAHNVKKSVDAIDFGAPFGIDTGEFTPGTSYSFTFAKPGEYFYTCTIHTGMNGRVLVNPKPAASSTTTSTP